MFRILPEQPADRAAIENLLDKVFGPGRFTRTAYRLRERVAPVSALSFCAWRGERLAGSIRFWPIEAGSHPALLLGPLVVDSAFQGQGAGRALIAQGNDAATALGHSLIILVGDLAYYEAFGYQRIPAGQLTMPGPVDPARLLWRWQSKGERPAAAQGLSGLIAKPSSIAPDAL